MAMLHSASCHIEVTFVEGLLEVSCDCYIEPEEGDPPYEMSVCSEVEVYNLEAYVHRCILLFQGLIEIARNTDDPDWEPAEAAQFVLAMIESVEDGTDFDMLSWEMV